MTSLPQELEAVVGSIDKDETQWCAGMLILGLKAKFLGLGLELVALALNALALV